MSDDDPTQQPGLSMGLAQYLAQLDPRPDVAILLEIPAPNRTLVLDEAEDLEAVAVALLMLERVAVHSGSRVPLRVIRPLRERATQPFDPKGVMQMEVEAYNALGWVASLKPEKGRRGDHTEPRQATRAGDSIRYDPTTPPIELLRRAIAEEFDVEIVYYTKSRGQLNKRRITPKQIEAETYLHAYCHTRRGDRVFRISRIAEVRPVDGRAVAAGRARGGRDDSGQQDLGF
ncbi:MAG: WYL domain-containing protein [Bradymonadales bacterium]|nr:WYL domain-containing protein [Bradymonadales bacterium]